MTLNDHHSEAMREIAGGRDECPKCGSTRGGCPVYHGMVGDGFCPVFRDGQTALETATWYHDAWLSKCRQNDRLTDERKQLCDELARLKSRGLIARILNSGPDLHRTDGSRLPRCVRFPLSFPRGI